MTEVNMASDFIPLHVACSRGHFDIVNSLIIEGADVNSCDSQGKSSLYLACFNKNAKIVQLLLEKGANVDNCNLLNLTCKYGNLEIVRLLTSHGADVNSCNEDGYSPLHFACEEGHLGIVQL